MAAEKIIGIWDLGSISDGVSLVISIKEFYGRLILVFRKVSREKKLIVIVFPILKNISVIMVYCQDLKIISIKKEVRSV